MIGLKKIRRGVDRNLPLAVIAETRGLQNAGEKIRISVNTVLVRQNGEVRSHRHAGRGDKRLFRVAVLGDRHRFSERSRTAALLCEIRERRRRNIFKFGADSGADGGNFVQCFPVFIASLNTARGNFSRGADFTRIQNQNVIPEARGGRTEHTAELTAAHHSKPGAGRKRFRVFHQQASEKSSVGSTMSRAAWF